MRQHKSNRKSGPRPKSLVGRRFGALKVIERAGQDKHGIALWRCQCDCGQFRTLQGAFLKVLNARECVCQRRRGRPKKLLVVAGEVLTVDEIAAKFDLPRTTVQNRLRKVEDSPSVESFAQLKRGRPGRLIQFRGEKLTISEWSDRTGLSADMIRDRLSRGWSVDNALTKAPGNRPSR